MDGSVGWLVSDLVKDGEERRRTCNEKRRAEADDAVSEKLVLEALCARVERNTAERALGVVVRRRELGARGLEATAGEELRAETGSAGEHLGFVV